MKKLITLLAIFVLFCNQFYSQSFVSGTKNQGISVASIPDLVSPANISSGVSIKPYFEWIDNGADGYKIQIASSSNFTNDLIVEHSVGSGTNGFKFWGYIYPEIPLDNNVKYFWRVIADFGGSDYPSDIWEFTTVDNIIVDLWNPGNETKLYQFDPAQFSWSINQAIGSTKFLLQIVENPTEPDYIQWASFEITAAQGSNPVYWFDNLTDLYTAVAGLTGGSKYYWRVCAYFDDGISNNVFDKNDRVISYSPIHNFSTMGGTVKAYPSWPAGGNTLYSLTPTFFWYTLEYDANAIFTIVYTKSSSTDINGNLNSGLTSVLAGSNTYLNLISELDPAETYYWQVVTFNNGLEYSDIETFDTYDAPGITPIAVTPSYPTGGIEIYTTAPTFNWYTEGYNIDVEFTVEISTDDTFGIIDYTLSPTTSSYIQSISLAPGNNYYWRVKSSKPGFTDVYSETAEFSITGGLSSFPVANWPVGNPTLYINTPTLSWYMEGSAIGWTHYKVAWSKKHQTDWLAFIGSNPDSSHITADMNETFYTIDSDLDFGSKYYWAVTAHDHPSGPYSSVAEGSFSIAGNDANIVQSNPGNNFSVYSKSPTFNWYIGGSLLGVTTYRLTYSNTENFSSNVETVVTTSTSAVVNSPLTEGATYWWFVELSYDGGSTWENSSAIWKFTVDPGTSSVVPFAGSPAMGITIEATSPTLSWYLPAQSASALSYDIEISDNVYFSNPIVISDISSESAVVNDLNAGEYFWRVKSKVPAGNEGAAVIAQSGFSQIANFKIGSVTGLETENELPETFSLEQNYPNPFNPATSINYTLPTSNFVTVKVYDMLGQEIKTLVSEDVKAGTHTTNWSGKNNYGVSVSSGTYIYRITAGNFVQSKKMILLK